MIEHDVHILKSAHVSPEVRQRIDNLASRMRVKPLAVDTMKRARFPFGSQTVVAGGDGMSRWCFQGIIDNGGVRLIGTIGGGSNNVIYNALVGEGHVTSEDEFVDAVSRGAVPEKALAFRPGIVEVNGAKMVFGNDVGMGVYEQQVGKANQLLRGIPARKAVSRVAALAMAVPGVIGQGRRAMDIKSHSGRVGEVELVKGHTLADPEIARMWIEGNRVDQMRKLIMVLWLMQSGKGRIDIPHTLLRTEKKLKHTAELQGNNVWLDGDTISVNGKRGKEVTIYQSPQEISFVAIK